MNKVIKSPIRLRMKEYPGVNIFLAGSIEMGTAEDWQSRVGRELSKVESVGCIFDPRRDDWDSSWVQDISNPSFNEQVNWELDHIMKSQIVFFYFDPNTKSPITLMELGYAIGKYAGYKQVIVCCPKGFWRKGNVDILCSRNEIHVYQNLREAIYQLKLSCILMKELV